MMRAWLESAAAGGTPANNAHNRIKKRKGITLPEIMFTPSRGRCLNIRRCQDQTGFLPDALSHPLASRWRRQASPRQGWEANSMAFACLAMIRTQNSVTWILDSTKVKR